MTASKRISAPTAGSVGASTEDIAAEKDVRDDQPFVPFLSHITEGSTIRDLDPTCCIPLYLFRRHSDNAVLRLISILNGEGAESCKDVCLTGMISGPPTSVVVPLVGLLYKFVEDYAADTFNDPSEGAAFKRRHHEWFGIIDGCHVHSAIMELRSEYPVRWGSVKWKVFCVRPGHEVDEYRKLAVVQNERNKHMYHFEPTLYEMLAALRRIYDKLYDDQLKRSRVGARGVNVLHRDVAQMYDGGEHERNTTIRQTVSVASRLSARAIEAIGEVANMACPDIILTNTDLNAYKLTSRTSVLSSYDCRLFKKFVCTSTLRGATLFMNAIRDDEEDAQVNAIHRVRHWCEKNNYRSAKPSVLNAQYQLAKLALDEECKFLTIIKHDDWPELLHTTRQNLLRTTAFDDQLSTNGGNTTDVISKIWESFKRSYPSMAFGIEQSLAAKNTPENDPESTTDAPPAPDVMNDEDRSAEQAMLRAEEEAKKKEEERRLQLRKDADQHLNLSGISTYSMPLSDFIRDVWSATSQRVDLVLSAIPPNITSSMASELPEFCSAVLKTGCYIFLLLSELQFSEFYQLFHDHGFKVCNHSFSIHYKNNSARKRRIIDFPHRNSEIALIAKTKGQHPAGFDPDFISGEESNEDQQPSSSLASFFNVDPCSDKLKRPRYNTPMFPEEKSVDLFSRIVRMFTPAEGICIDPFGGPLTTALSCLDTGRTCISMDTSGDALRYATGRLRIFATPSATMQLLEEYTDPILSSEALDDNDGNSVPFTKNPSPKRKRVNEANGTLTSPTPSDTTVPDESQGSSASSPDNSSPTVSPRDQRVKARENRNSSADKDCPSVESHPSQQSTVATTAQIDETLQGVDALLSMQHK